MNPIINSQVPEFNVQAFQNGKFKSVSNNDVKGKWGIFFFYPADFTFVCPTELVDMADKYEKFQEMGVTPVATSPTEFADFIKAQTEQWKQVIEAGNIKPQ